MTDTVKSATASDAAASDTAVSEVEKQGFRWTTAAIWFGLLTIIAVLGWSLIQVQKGQPTTTAPDFEMQFFDGYDWQGMTTANLSDFQGQPVVLNFWASWCVECKLEADLLEQTWRQYKDDGLVFLGVAYVDVEPKSIKYLEDFNITYPNAPDLRTAVSEEYGITGVPETFFISKDGQIIHHQIGPVNEAMINTLVTSMLSSEG
jgi:cytochrome c biogenesis protein CcmG/thiol:disulfide interchange protein DsbE